MKRSDVFLKCTQNLISRWITNKLLISLRCVSYKKAYKYGILFYFVLFYFILFEWMWGSADRRGVWVALRKVKLLFVISYVKLDCYLIWICNKYSNPSALCCVSYCCRCWGWQEVLLLRTRQSSHFTLFLQPSRNSKTRDRSWLPITPDEPETRTTKSLDSLGIVYVNVINLRWASAAEQDSLHFKFDNNNFYSHILNTYTPSAIAYRRESRIPILILSSPF